MSDLEPNPELRPRSELRTRPSAMAGKGIARHGQLPRPKGWPLVLGIIGAALTVILVSVGSIGAIAINSVYSKKTVVQLVGQTEGPPPQIGAIQGGFNILIVGSDTRAGQGGVGGTLADDQASLNDVTMLIHVSHDQTNAVALSIPRDMVVGIPECVGSDGYKKDYSTEALNTALSYGGLSCIAQTVTLLTGLPIQFAGMITFQGVIAMTSAIGGVDVCITAPMVDPATGINLPAAGTYNISGDTALAFLRSRHGVGDGSDLTRISSQQSYLSSLVRKLKSSDTLNDYKKLYDLANGALSTMTLSNNLADLPTMVSIALVLKNIPLQRVTFVQYPGTTGNTEGVYAGKVKPDTYRGDKMIAYIAADQPFVLDAAGDGRGTQANPNAPVPTADPTAPPVSNAGPPVLAGVRGQTAADYTCSITQTSDGEG